MLKSGAVLLGVAHVLETALPFARNIATARLMEPREFAISLAIVTAIAVFEQISDVGIAQFALKADVANARFRATLHSLAAIRASAIGVLLCIVSVPLAVFLKAPGLWSAFSVAGLSITIRGFSNIAVRQATRDSRYAPEAIAICVSQIVWTVAVIGFSFYWRDHRAMVASLIVYALAHVCATHLLTRERYSFAWDRDVVRGAVDFGKPLIPNGFALAATSLVDRLLVGGLRSLEALALYGPLSSTAMLPRGTALRYVYNIALPRMERESARALDVAPTMKAWSTAIALLAATLGLGFMCLAEPVIRLVFGVFYSPAPILTLLMGLLLTLRVIAAYPVPLAMVRARTWFVTASSMISALALAPGAACLVAFDASLTQSLAAMLGGMALFESLGVATIVLRTQWDFAEARASAMPVVIAFLTVAGVALLAYLVGAQTWIERLPYASAGLIAVGALLARPLLAAIQRNSAI